jgi:hypothetical protein
MRAEGFVVFIDRRLDQRPILQALSGEAARIFTRWSDFSGMVGNAAAAGIVIQDLTRARTRDGIALRAARPLLPLVLVTSVGPDTPRRINRLPELEEIVRLEDLSDRFRGALNDAANRRLLLQAAAWIQTQEHLPPELRLALEKACRRPDPLRTVDALAKRALGASPRVFRALWKRADPRTKPHAFIDWLLLAHAAAKRHAGLSVEGQARLIGVDSHTLQAARKRLLGAGNQVIEEAPELLHVLERALGRQTDEGQHILQNRRKLPMATARNPQYP